MVDPEVLDQDLRLKEGLEDLPVEQLASELAVEGFDKRVLPGAAGLDVAGGGVGEAAPVPKGVGDELGPVVQAEKLW